MRLLYLLLLILFCQFPITNIYAQPCPPVGFPNPGNTCPLAPILCENLDGYCATINNSNTPQNFPGCSGGWTLNNDEWFAFYAGSTSINIQVIPSNCSPGSNQGLQGAIYAGCGPPWTVMDAQCSCTDDPFNLIANNYVVGQIYWFVLDGCGGNVCDYAIDVISGSTVGAPPANPGPITGALNVCQNTSGGYSITPPSGATIYTWTLDPSSAGTITGNGASVNVTWANGAPATAELCVAVANACYPNNTPSCITVNINPIPTATISGSGILCPGSGGSTGLTVSFTGNPPWTFTPALNGVPQAPITTSENPYNYTVTQAGTYTLVSVNSNGCTGTVSGSASVTSNNLNASATTTAATCGQDNGSVNLSVTGGVSPYSFSWSNSATSEDLSNVPGGSYTVTVTDAAGCTRTVTATVADNLITLNISGTTTPNTTCTGGNGSVNITVSPGGTYTYQWSNSDTSEDLNNVPDGSYTVTVTTGLTCTASATFTVNNQPNIPNLSLTTTQTTCDFSNGSVNLTVSGGVTPYTFSWDNSAVSEDLSSVSAGTYSVTVTGANGCTATASATVTNNNPPINITGTATANTTCNSNNNGSIDISVSPAGTYTYNWSNTATTQDISNLPPGTYSVTVSAGGSCNQTADFTVPDNPNLPSASATSVSTTCELPNGSVTLSVSGGVAPYTFAWDNAAVTQNLSNVPAGSYSVTVTGANGCTTTTAVTVSNNNPPISVTATIINNTSCNASTNGAIDVSVSPAGSYTYSWSNTATTQDLTGLPPGTYSLTVTGQGSCSQTADFTVADVPNNPNASATATTTTCDLPNGNITLTVSGGVPPFTYLWDNAATTPNLTGVLAGTYSVTVTGANGCTDETTVTVNNNNPPISVTAVTQPNTVCIGTNNGSINVSVTPPGTYTFQWDNGLTTEDLSNLAPGDYTVTVTTGVSCTEVMSFTVPDQANLPVLSATTVQSTCDLSNGSINLTITGGIAPYTISWSNSFLIEDLSNIPAGDYSVTVTGANGCPAMLDVTVNNFNPPIFISDNIQPNTNCGVGNGNGSIDITVTPPGSYTYTWSNGSTSQDLTGLDPDIYTVTVAGQGSCSETATFTVPDDPNIPILNFNFTPATCGQSNGAVNLTVSAGVAPYTYLWSNGSASQDLNGVPADIYIVTVTGANGCSAIDGGNVDDNLVSITLDGTVTDQTSCITNNGSITLSITPPNLTVSWENGSSALVRNNLPPGDYSVTVSAGGTCTETATFTVLDSREYPFIVEDITEATCGLSNGSIDLDVILGILPYTYNWSNSANTQDLNNIPTGDYSVTVTSALGCSTEGMYFVPNNDISIGIFATIDDNNSCTTPNGFIDLTLEPAPNPYIVTWEGGQTTTLLENLPPGDYFVTVTLGSSCSAQSYFTLLDATTAPNISASAIPATCGLSNGGATLNVSGGVTPYTYNWSNGIMTKDLANLAPGTYIVTVTGFNACTSTATVVVPNNNIAINLSAVPEGNTSCTIANGGIDLTVNPAGTYTYSWSNLATTEDLSGVPSGSYTVTVSLGSCTASSTYNVPDNTTDPTITPVVTSSICGASNGAIDLTIGGASGPYTYNWSNTASSEDLTGILSGTYQVTVTAANGCTASSLINVPNNSSTFSLSVSGTPLTNCLNPNGSIDLVITPGGVPYGITWSTLATTEDLSNLPAGNYTATVTDFGSCTASIGFLVEDLRTYPSANSSVTPEVCGLSNGAIQVETTGGTLPYSYLWSSGQMTEDLSGIVDTTYQLTITDANNCTASLTAVVPENSITFSLSGATTSNTSCITPNGAVDLEVNPATGTYTYLWSNMATIEDISGLTPGPYTVTVSAGGTCTNIANFTVSSNLPPPQIIETVTPALCAQNSGAIDIEVQSGVGPFTFIWEDNSVNEDRSGLAPGDYTLTVTGANGCTASKTITVLQNVVTPDITGIPVVNSSCINPNGSIDITVTPNTLTYTFTWSNMAVTQNLSGLSAGTYSVTVDAGGNCSNVETFTIGSTLPPPVLSEVVTPAFCGQNSGSIDLTVTGPSTPFSFLWNDTATDEDRTGLVSNDYSVTVTGANGCTAEATISVPEDSVIPSITPSITQNTSCASPNGGIDISILPNTLNYTITWSNTDTATSLTGLLPGIYSVTVNGGGACTSTASFTVPTNTQSPSIQAGIQNVNCFGELTGAINLVVTGGTPSYQFNWNPAQAGNQEFINGIGAGTYNVTVTDALGCAVTGAYTVSQPAAAIQLLCSEASTVSAPGATDGIGRVAVSGGVAPYVINWSPGGTPFTSLGGLSDITGLSENGYTVTVTDANGCQAICSFVIGLVICETAVGTLQSTVTEVCGQGCATVTYNAAGQFLDPDDVFEFILHTGSSNQIVGELARSSTPEFCFIPGVMQYETTYYISAAAGDNNGSGQVNLPDYCTVVAPGAPVIFHEIPIAGYGQPEPLNCAVKQVELSGISSLPGSTFAWTTVDGILIGSANQQMATAGKAGIYNLTVSRNGCQGTTDVLVIDQSNTVLANAQASPTDILDCVIDEIILSGEVEGTNNPSTIWLANGITYPNSTVLMIDTPGTYVFIAIDTITQCSDTAVMIIQENLNYPPLFLLPHGPLTCSQPAITLSGGSVLQGIDFQWVRVADGDTTIVGSGNTLVVNTEGLYLFIGRDPSNQCRNSLQTVVTADNSFPQALIDGQDSIACFGATAILDGSASSGAAALNYFWSTPNGNITTGANTAAAAIDMPGTYLLLVTNPGNGCTDTEETVVNPREPIAEATIQQPPCYGDRGAITIDQVLGARPPVRYSLNGGPSTQQSAFTQLQPGNYTILITDALGCSTTVNAVLTEPAQFDLDIISEAIIKLGDSLLLTAVINVPPAEIATILWTPSTGLYCDTCLSTWASPQRSIRYQVYAETQSGCEDRAALTVYVDRRVDVYVPNVFAPDKEGDNDLFMIFGNPDRIRNVKTFLVFDRWGELVHEYYNFMVNDPVHGWNGMFNGEKLNPAVFVWYAEVELVDGEILFLEGDVTLER